jgi:hypothetical protein
MVDCFSCGKKIPLTQVKETVSDIQDWRNRRIPPENMTKKDRMCGDCVGKLPKIVKKTSEITFSPIPNLLFDSTQILLNRDNDVEIKCTTNRELNREISNSNQLLLYCYELGDMLVFYKQSKLGSKNLLELPISNIISTEVSIQKKRIGKKVFCIIKTSKDEITVQSKSAYMINNFIEQQLYRKNILNQTKEIKFFVSGTSRTLTINPYSPALQKDEEIIASFTTPEVGYVITNYRIFRNNYFIGTDKQHENYSISMVHDEYEDVIASNVERRMETDTVGGVDSRPSLWNSVPGLDVNLHYNQEKHHSSSVESEIGDIIFMNNGKQAMVWKNFSDPNSLIQQINSAKSHFTAPQTTSAPQTTNNSTSSVGEDPIQTLKLRFAKGEITKEEFTEMKSLLE